MSDLHECPEHGTAFHLPTEPCWPCYIRAMYGGSQAGVVHPLPQEHAFWVGLEQARGTWRPVKEEPMLSDLDTLAQFLRVVEHWPPADRAELGRVANALEAEHPSIYGSLMDGLKGLPVAIVLPYAVEKLHIHPVHRPWFELLVMELCERAKNYA